MESFLNILAKLNTFFATFIQPERVWSMHWFGDANSLLLIKVCVTNNCEPNSLTNEHITLLGMIRQRKKAIKILFFFFKKLKLDFISCCSIVSTSNNALQTLPSRGKILNAPVTRGDYCTQSFNEGGKIKRNKKRSVCHFHSRISNETVVVEITKVLQYERRLMDEKKLDLITFVLLSMNFISINKLVLHQLSG